MNQKISSFISNFAYTLGANIITLLVSVIMITLIPKILGVEDYGYFQLYTLYTSYAIFFHLGLPNGIYLRYGGKEYKSLDHGLFTFQFRIITLYTLAMGAVGSVLVYVTLGVDAKGYILQMTLLCGAIIIPRDILLLTLQATNRIRDYVKATILDRLVYISFVLWFMLPDTRTYSSLIKADLYGKAIALAWLLFLCRDMVFSKVIRVREGLRETWANIAAGSKILVSNIADLLIIGSMRMGIETHWDIETFGRISLTLSLSNLIMVVINAVSIVLYPMLRRTSQEELSRWYQVLSTILMVPLLGMITIYYPAKELLALWLPNYADSLTYVVLLFPICIYQSKMSMLVNTYLKNLRKEHWILLVNILSVCLSIITSMVTIFMMDNLVLAILAIVAVLSFRTILAEVLLSRYLKLKVTKDIVLELFLCIWFMVTGWLIQGILGTLCYAICYGIYLLLKRKDLVSAIHEIKVLAVKST